MSKILRKFFKSLKFYKNPIHPPIGFWPLSSHSAARYQQVWTKDLKPFFLLSTSCHEEVLRSIGEVNTRISNLETIFDEFTHTNDDDDMSAEF